MDTGQAGMTNLRVTIGNSNTVHLMGRGDPDSDDFRTICGLSSSILDSDLALDDDDDYIMEHDDSEWHWRPVTCPKCLRLTGITTGVKAMAVKPVEIRSDRRARYWREDPNGEHCYKGVVK